jgi:hypothetical protein
VKEADISARKGRRTTEKESETKRELELDFDMPTKLQYNMPSRKCAEFLRNSAERCDFNGPQRRFPRF